MGSPPTYEDLRRSRAAERDRKSARVVGEGMAGKKYTHPLPRRVYFVATGSPDIPLSSYQATIDSDAAYVSETDSRSMAWVIHRDGQVLLKEGVADLHGVGNNCAEVSASIGGLARAHAEGFNRVLLRTDSRLASHLIAKVNDPKQPRVAALRDALYSELANFEAVGVAWTPEKELKAVDKFSKLLLRTLGHFDEGHNRRVYSAVFLEKKPDPRHPRPGMISDWSDGLGLFP